MLVQIAVCKCHPYKFKPMGAESAASAGGEGPAVYKQVDGGEGSVAVNGRILEKDEGTQ